MRLAWILMLICGFARTGSGADLAVRRLTGRELADAAEMIVLGKVRVKSVASAVSGAVETHITLAVGELWKGAVVSTNAVQFMVPGGVLGEKKLWITGQPEFALGEHCLVFLRKSERDGWILTGFDQGKFSVHQPLDHGPGVISPPPLSYTAQGAAIQPAWMRLPEFKRQIMEGTETP